MTESELDALRRATEADDIDGMSAAFDKLSDDDWSACLGNVTIRERVRQALERHGYEVRSGRASTSGGA
jgi:hypothetical protein